jgi:RNA polymerase sigma-70 factor (ECF subfamily)
MAVSQELRDGLVSNIPSLRAFAYSLCGNATRADDLVQETMVKAWANFASFQEGTNLRAWLFTILRNEFYSQMRKKGREVEDADGKIADKQPALGNQESHVELQDLKSALAELPEDQREAIILIGASGLAYEEAAEICGVPVGTMKSRVSRARKALTELMGYDDAELAL